MKNNNIKQIVFALALLGRTVLSAQHVVTGCEAVIGSQTFLEPTFEVTATGSFINPGTAYFSGVTTFTNDGGISEQVESDCIADYRNPCNFMPGVSGANFFDNYVAATTINGTSPLRMYAATIDRNIQLNNEWQILNAFTFTSGLVTTDRSDPSHFLHFRSGSSVINADSDSHVNGYAGWSGTGAFLLPVGDGTKQMPVTVTGDCSSVFKAAYFSVDPDLATLPIGAPFSTESRPAGIRVSQKDYWDIHGATATPITLSFDADSDWDLIAANISQLVILGWNGTAWVNLGQTGSTGTLTGAGAVTCAPVTPDDYSAFTLGAKVVSVTCPADVTRSTDEEMDNNCSVSESLNHPTADSGDPVTLSIAFTAGTPAPAGTLPTGGTVTEGGNDEYEFGVGETIVTYTADDQNGITGSCSFTVTVNDNEQPTITGSLTTEEVEGCTIADAPAAATTVAELEALTGNPAVSDNCTSDNALTVSHSDINAGTCPIVITRTYTITDATGNAATLTQTLNIDDTTAPAVSGDLDTDTLTLCYVSDTTAPATTISALEALDADTDLDISDACTADGSLIVSCTSSVTGAQPNFTLTRTYIITDLCDNTTSLTHTIQITVTCFTITGKLLHAQSLPAQVGVEAANVRLTGSQTDAFTTTASGEYSLPVNTAGFNPHTAIVRPHKTNNKLNGVSVADATRITQHITGNNPFTDVHDVIAADVNLSKSVSSSDGVLITQALRGSSSALAQIDSSWRFVSSSHVFPNPPYYPTPTAASSFWSFPLHRAYTNLNRDTSNQDFIGIKMGDVISPASTPNRPGAENTLTLIANDRVLRAGEEVEVAFRVVNFQDLSALQFALRFDAGRVDYRGFSSPESSPLKEGHFGFYNVESGEIRAVWSVPQGMDLPDGARVFNLRFAALEDGVQLSSVLRLDDEALPREAYHTDLSPLAIDLQFIQRARPTGVSSRASEDESEQPAVLLLQNQPNPFSDRTTIGFVLGEPMHARLRVFDLTGRLLFERAANYPAGYQSVDFQLDSNADRGLLLYELTTPFGTQTRKMIGGE